MTIGIIGAMDEEIAHLKAQLKNSHTVTIAGSLFIEGNLYEKKIVLVKSGIGKVNAAMTTTILIEHYQPTFIINTGSAGGFSKELNVGDIVIGKEVVHHDVDVTGFNYVYGQVPGLPPTFKADEALIKRIEKTLDHLDLRYEIGLIATGDSFMNDPVRIKYIKSKLPEMIAFEMEAAAIAQICHQYKVPFVVIRALSDIAGKEAPISFDAFLTTAAENAANLIMDVIMEQ